MGSIDHGTQQIYFKYGQGLVSSDLNKWFYSILKAGVYDGGALTISSGEIVQIAPLNVVVETSLNQSIHVKTTTNVLFPIDELTPYITCQMTWADSAINYMDFTAKAVGDLLSTDVIIGKGVYVMGTLTSFDYSEKTWGFFNRDGDIHSEGTIYSENIHINDSNLNHVALLEPGYDMRILSKYKPISSTFPWLCMSLSDRTLTTTNYSVEFISELRSRKVVYDEMDTAVSSFSGTWASSDFTLDNNAANIEMITELYEDWLFAGSPTSGWRILVSNGIEYNITGFTVASRIITVSGSPSGTSIEIYLHRIMGSTTSAKHFSWAGLGLYMIGGGKVSGLRRRDAFQGHRMSPLSPMTSFNQVIGGAVIFGGGNYGIASGSTTGDPVTDGTNGDPRTASKTRIESGTLSIYLYVGSYTA